MLPIRPEMSGIKVAKYFGENYFFKIKYEKHKQLITVIGNSWKGRFIFEVTRDAFIEGYLDSLIMNQVDDNDFIDNNDYIRFVNVYILKHITRKVLKKNHAAS